ncbi:TPA: hypothetical protein L5U90_003354 [Pseudomonas aeruginosa]|nr:hypothetical protein [Pseudomonas aeruginosa]
MSTIGKIVIGIITGYILAIIIGALMLQAMMFLEGLELLGISHFGLFYFLGGFLASLGLLVTSPAARSWKRLLMLYPVAIVFVAAVGGIHTIEADIGFPKGALADPSRLLNDMGHLLATVAFWLVPVIVIAAYSVLTLDKRPASAA